MTTADWIAVDWGTSQLRAWAMSASGTILDSAHSDRGMGQLSPPDFEPALRDLIVGWVNGPIDVIACGMAGARQGWTDAGYHSVPSKPIQTPFASAPTTGSDLRVHIVPGISQNDPADVMRGEETQIAGFLSLNPNWDGVICLPGTHTKWVHVSAEEIVSFQTVMTGDLFAAISLHTVLRHSLADDAWDDASFLEGLDQAMARPERLAARLFSLRAEDLLRGLPSDKARSRLSGLLIGSELAATKPYWLGQQVAVIGNDHLSAAYRTALQTQSVPALQTRADHITVAGLTTAYRLLKG